MKAMTRSRNTIDAALLLPLIVLFCGQMDVQAQSADALLERLQNKYRQIDAIAADFEQTTKIPHDASPETTSGRILLREKSYRVETGSQTFVTDGTTTWIYTPANGQVLVNDYVEDETSFSLNDFLFNTSAHYKVTQSQEATVGETAYHKLRLVPRAAGNYLQHIDVWVRADDMMITRIDVLDVNAVEMRYDLTDITLNPSVSPAIFTFTAPDDVEVIDLRS